MLKNAYLDAKIGVDPAENEPPMRPVMRSWPMRRARRAGDVVFRPATHTQRRPLVCCHPGAVDTAVQYNVHAAWMEPPMLSDASGQRDPPRVARASPGEGPCVALDGARGGHAVRSPPRLYTREVDDSVICVADAAASSNRGGGGGSTVFMSALCRPRG